MAWSNPRSADQPGAFLSRAGNADDRGALYLGDLASQRADRTGGAGDHEGLPGFDLTDIDDAHIGGPAGPAEQRLEMPLPDGRPPISGILFTPLGRQGAIVAPTAETADDLTLTWNLVENWTSPPYPICRPTSARRPEPPAYR